MDGWMLTVWVWLRSLLYEVAVHLALPAYLGGLNNDLPTRPTRPTYTMCLSTVSNTYLPRVYDIPPIENITLGTTR
ncbi:hypothetical protein F5X96DRAFT_230304 [Biscogniauxia mediterranea]|nr:hypothetical protein F5X96DRAFT_230304 [Biscogniauxia mediterranea]